MKGKSDECVMESIEVMSIKRTTKVRNHIM